MSGIGTVVGLWFAFQEAVTGIYLERTDGPIRGEVLLCGLNCFSQFFLLCAGSASACPYCDITGVDSVIDACDTVQWCWSVFCGQIEKQRRYDGALWYYFQWCQEFVYSEFSDASWRRVGCQEVFHKLVCPFVAVAYL